MDINIFFKKLGLKIIGLKFIFMPGWWYMAFKYNEEVDRTLLDLLERYEFSNISTHHAYLGYTKLWIANLPYAGMTFYDSNNHEIKLRASRLTIEKAIKRLEKKQLANLANQVLTDVIRHRERTQNNNNYYFSDI